MSQTSRADGAGLAGPECLARMHGALSYLPLSAAREVLVLEAWGVRSGVAGGSAGLSFPPPNPGPRIRKGVLADPALVVIGWWPRIEGYTHQPFCCVCFGVGRWLPVRMRVLPPTGPDPRPHCRNGADRGGRLEHPTSPLRAQWRPRLPIFCGHGCRPGVMGGSREGGPHSLGQ